MTCFAGDPSRLLIKGKPQESPPAGVITAYKSAWEAPNANVATGQEAPNMEMLPKAPASHTFRIHVVPPACTLWYLDTDYLSTQQRN